MRIAPLARKHQSQCAEDCRDNGRDHDNWFTRSESCGNDEGDDEQTEEPW
jgi:hypothetical protein